MMKTYLVVGLGRFGTAVAKRLAELKKEVLVMDVNEDLVQQTANFVTRGVIGDSKDKEVLRALGAGNYDCAVVAIGKDLTASILTTINLKDLVITMVVCKAQDESHKKVLEKIGADRVVFPEREMASRLAQGLASANVMEYIELSPDYGIVEFEAPAKWTGKNLRELNIRAKIGVNIIAIRTQTKILVSPSADYEIKAGNIIVALGDSRALNSVQKL